MLPKPVVEEHSGFLVVRDDLLLGGTKMRAIMPLISNSLAAEFVYASPAQGYAQVALAYCARMAGRKATIFTAKRKEMHPLTLRAKQAGAKIVMVPYGYLSVVQARLVSMRRRSGLIWCHLVLRMLAVCSTSPQPPSLLACSRVRFGLLLVLAF